MPKMHALITALILDRPLCLTCIGAKTRLGPDEVDADLKRIGEILMLNQGVGECRSCGTVTIVLSAERPSA